MEMRHSHEVYVDGKSQLVGHVHEVDPGSYWNHNHEVKAGRGMKVSKTAADAAAQASGVVLGQ